MTRITAVAAALAALSAPAFAQVQITEWMYNGGSNDGFGEFVEFTNLGSTPVDFAGWSYDDDSRIPGVFSLSGFGVVAPGESVVITERTAAEFRTVWSLPAGVKVLGGYANNLGRADEINLFDAGGNLVDRFAYGDQAFPGTPRTQLSSGNPTSLAALAPDHAVVGDWVLSVTGDAYGSYFSSANEVGNPGTFALVPEPGTLAMLAAGLGIVGGVARRRA